VLSDLWFRLIRSRVANRRGGLLGVGPSRYQPAHGVGPVSVSWIHIKLYPEFGVSEHELTVSIKFLHWSRTANSCRVWIECNISYFSLPVNWNSSRKVQTGPNSHTTDSKTETDQKQVLDLTNRNSFLNQGDRVCSLWLKQRLRDAWCQHSNRFAADFLVSGWQIQESCAIAKMTARCVLYMSALKVFETLWLCLWILFPNCFDALYVAQNTCSFTQYQLVDKNHTLYCYFQWLYIAALHVCRSMKDVYVWK